jgi:hypothetical protein
MWKHDNTTFSYEILWRAAHTALNMAEVKDPRIRVDHLSIHSILTGFLAFEGFINFVGDEIAPEIWKTERDFFSGPNFRGIVGKIEYLFTLFPNVALIKGEEPYQTFRRIKETRDNLAHNRVLLYTEITSDEEWRFRTKWEDFDTPEKIKPALQRLKEFAELIRIEAVKLLNEDYALSHLHFKAFEGPLGGSEGEEIG